MNSPDASSSANAHEPGRQTLDLSIPELVAEVYAAAPAAERGHMLEQLLRPLGVLSLFAVAGGVFASLRLRCGWPQLKVQLDDIRHIRSDHIVALVDYTQQVSVEAVEGLAQVLTASPLMSGSAAAALLVTALMQRARSRLTADVRIDASSVRSN